LSSEKCERDQGQHAAGFQGVGRLGNEEVMQRQLLAAVVELHVGEWHVADCGVNRRQFGSPEALDADVGIGVKRPGDASRDGIHLDADEAHSWPAVAHEVADAAAGFQHRGSGERRRRATAS